MKKLESSFDECDMNPKNDTLDQESSKNLKRDALISAQKANAVKEANHGNFSFINKIREEEPQTPTAEGVKYEDIYVNYGDSKILTRHYYPENCQNPTSLPILIYVHGGGWCFSSIHHRNFLASQFTIKHNLEVVSINHSLSPEFKYGRAIDEIYAVYCDILKKSPDDRIIFLGGDSSGGNIAPCVIHKIKNENNKVRMPTALLLFYPVCDLVTDYPSNHRFGSGFMLDYDLFTNYMNAYCPNEDERKNPLVSPLFGDLHNFPPSLVITSQFDILRNGGLAFAKKLNESGVPVRYICMKTAAHGFFTDPSIRLSEIAHNYIDDFLKYFV